MFSPTGMAKRLLKGLWDGDDRTKGANKRPRGSGSDIDYGWLWDVLHR